MVRINFKSLKRDDLKLDYFHFPYKGRASYAGIYLLKSDIKAMLLLLNDCLVFEPLYRYTYKELCNILLRYLSKI